jgi:hypothetical protein
MQGKKNSSEKKKILKSMVKGKSSHVPVKMHGNLVKKVIEASHIGDGGGQNMGKSVIC